MAWVGGRNGRWLILVVALSWMGCRGAAIAQETPAPAAATQEAPAKTEDVERPLPDIPTLMRSVEANEKTAEAVEKDYMYRASITQVESDGHGNPKKTETLDVDVFWIEGVKVRRLVKKDGKELSDKEQKKENEKIDREVADAKAKRAKADAKGAETDPEGNAVVTVSRLLELGSFTNARREQWNGRDTIAVDFAGDPKAKTKNRFEDVIRDLQGTAWIDERDKVLVKAEGHFLNNFKVGGGLLVNIQKGTSFRAEWKKVNDEVWLPASQDGQGSLRALLFLGFNGKVHFVDSDYRKFKVTSTIRPGMSEVKTEPDPK
jgi:hypothetical protein